MPARPLLLIDDEIPDEPLAPLAAVAEVVRFAGPAGLEEWVAGRGPQVVGLGVLLSTPVDAALLDRLPRLRLVAVYAVGVDNVDLAAAAARAVVVTHTPGVLTDATADLTWALILAVARRLPEAEALARSGEWTGWRPRQLLGRSLAGGTLAVLGLGRIGAAVARRGLGFGMEVVYWSRSARPELERDWGLRRLELEPALRAADVVSIHLPLTPETRRLLDARRIGWLRPDAILVNTARGPIVDEDALADALAAGKLFGAGLDVYADEPRIPARLRASARVVLLPHLGSATGRARADMARLVAENLGAAVTGRPAPTPVLS